MEVGAGARSLAPVGERHGCAIVMLSHDFASFGSCGSHLNMAEIKLSVLSRQCLNRRIPEMATLKTEVTAWCNERNEKETWIDWRFTTQNACIKLLSDSTDILTEYFD